MLSAALASFCYHKSEQGNHRILLENVVKGLCSISLNAGLFARNIGIEDYLMDIYVLTELPGRCKKKKT